MAAICIGLCLLTSLVFGFLPAFRFSRPVVISALKDDAGAGGLRVGRVHRFTAALQVAIAVAIRLELRAAGTPIPANDVWIAALSRQHAMPVMSRDSHFDFVRGLRQRTW